MLKEFVEKIITMAEPNIKDINGYTYTDKPLSVVKIPHPETIEFSSLSGLCEVIKKEGVLKDGAPYILRITSHNKVDVYTRINNKDMKRSMIYTAMSSPIDLELNRYISHEKMMILLKSKFIETPELLERVKLLGTIVDEKISSVSDDGFTQSVVVRQGVALKSNRPVNPIATLKPYRTFLEVDQPESQFLFRLRDNGEVALYEADGGAWKLEAKQNIATYLKENLNDMIEKKLIIVV